MHFGVISYRNKGKNRATASEAVALDIDDCARITFCSEQGR